MGWIKLFSIVLIKRKKYAVCIITNAINRENICWNKIQPVKQDINHKISGYWFILRSKSYKSVERTNEI